MLENVAIREIHLQNVPIINMEVHHIFAHLIREQKWVNCGTVIAQDQLIQNVGMLQERLIQLSLVI